MQCDFITENESNTERRRPLQTIEAQKFIRPWRNKKSNCNFIICLKRKLTVRLYRAALIYSNIVVFTTNSILNAKLMSMPSFFMSSKDTSTLYQCIDENQSREEVSECCKFLFRKLSSIFESDMIQKKQKQLQERGRISLISKNLYSVYF